MLLSFFSILRKYNLPVSTREMLDCLGLFAAGVIRFDLTEFYVLSRVSLIKDEKFYDRFDQAFDHFLQGIDQSPAPLADPDVAQMLREVLEKQPAYHDYMARVETLFSEYKQSIAVSESSTDAVIVNGEHSAKPAGSESAEPDQQGGHRAETSTDESGERNRKSSDSADSEKGDCEGDGEGEGEGEKGEEGEGEEGEEGEQGQKGRGSSGIDGEGESELGEQGEKQTFEQSKRLATKLWSMRRFAELDSEVELGTRNMKIALRRIRKFARTGADLELDLGTTIANTARNAGLLDIVEIPERHNSVKVLLLMDVGGSMDEHILLCEQLFSAARYEFKHLEYYYFHNFIYEKVWTDAAREPTSQVPTVDLIRKFSSDYKIIVVSDADMGRHEITETGGSVEHYNAQPGEVWLQRILDHFRKVVWLKPKNQRRWQDSESTKLIQRLVEDEMYPLNVSGIDLAARSLTK